MDHERKSMKTSKAIVKNDNPFGSCNRVLLVDHDQTSLKSLKEMLKQSHYKVVAVDKAEKALDILHRKKEGFDILLVDATLPLMNGLDLLEIIVKNFKIPVLMMCSENKIEFSLQAFKLGASFVFSKPLNKQNVQNMWQHAYNTYGEKHKAPKSLRKSFVDDSESSFSSKNEVGVQLACSKVKTRVSWTPQLHQKFLQAIHILGCGFQNALPEKIVEVMNVRGLTRTHVASHLQKFRLSMKSNVVRRNRWNSPNGPYRSNFGVSYDPLAWRHKEPRSSLVPNALSQQMPTAVLPENETNDLSPSSFMPQFGSQSHNFQGQLDNNFMNQGNWHSPIMIDAGDTPKFFGCTSNYMVPTVFDQATNDGFPIEETFQNMSIQSQEVSPNLPILDSGDMDALVTGTESLEFDQAGIDYSASEGNPNGEWSFNIDDLILSGENQVNVSGDISMNLDRYINEAGMLTSTDSSNTPIYADMSMEENKSCEVNFKYMSDEGISAMSLAVQAENDDSWLKTYNELANYVSQQGNPTAHEEQQRGISMEAAVLEMQTGNDPMSAEEIAFLAKCSGLTDGNSNEM